MNVLASNWVPPPPSGVAIGVFDGVHRGHAQVIRRLVARCRERDLAPGVLTFDPHPVQVLAPDYAPPLLMPVARRVEALEELGVDWVGTLDLGDVRLMEPEEFVVKVLVSRASTRLVSVGDDFRFGRDRAGDVSVLESAGLVHGFEVVPVELVHDEGGVISSTRIRTLLSEARVEEAARLLGRPYRVEGVVVQGDSRGRELGFPTANMVPPRRLAVPTNGIYAVRVEGDVTGPGVASIGVRPTFGSDGDRLLEVYLFEFDRDIYGAHLAVDFVAHLRDEERFESVDALVEQMGHDAAQARAILDR